MLDETQEVVTETPVIETPTTKTTSELTDDVKSKVIASLTEEDYLKFIEESETGTKVSLALIKITKSPYLTTLKTRQQT